MLYLPKTRSERGSFLEERRVAVEVLVAPDLLVLAFIVILESEADLVSFDPEPGLQEGAILTRL